MTRRGALFPGRWRGRGAGSEPLPLGHVDVAALFDAEGAPIRRRPPPALALLAALAAVLLLGAVAVAPGILFPGHPANHPGDLSR